MSSHNTLRSAAERTDLLEVFKTKMATDVSMKTQQAEVIDKAINIFMTNMKPASRNVKNLQVSHHPQIPSTMAYLLRLKRKVMKEYERSGDVRIQKTYQRLT